MRPRWIVFFVLATLAIHGKSLRYEFVYDDHFRVETNPAIKSLSNFKLFFTDPATSSSNPMLHHDSYRPFVTLAYALEHAIFGERPAGYRLTNLILHALNGWMVAAIGMVALELSVAAGIFAGLLFLLHPIQVGSVVWIAEQTNVLGTFFMLGSFLFWWTYLETRKIRWAVATHLALGASLMSREVAVVLPFILIMATFLHEKYLRLKGPERYQHAITVALVIVYLFLRDAMIGRTKIADYWGGTLSANLANVSMAWPLYLRAVLWPHPLKISYADLEPAAGWSDPRAIVGFLLLVAVIGAAVIYWRRSPRATFCAAWLLLLWLPGSNIIPWMGLFGERLLYPIVPAAGWLIGMALDAARWRWKWWGAALLIAVLEVGSFAALPAWRNELSLWKKAASVSPNNWFVWACLGQEYHRLGLLPEAKAALRESLRFQVPESTAATLFLESATVNLTLGNKKLAEEEARRALELRPELAKAWENARRRIVLISPTEQ